MEEVLAEMDQKYSRMTQLRVQVDSAAAALRQ